MPAEVELKFHVSRADLGRLRAAAALRGARPRTRRLETIYFDTPGGELAAHDMALRLRRAGARWIEGLKAGRSGTGGLHARSEWEFERDDAGIDLARFARTPLARLDDAAHLHQRLARVFRVDVQRTTWVIARSPGSRLEVALDVGRVECGGRRARICELEIECLEGGAEGAFELAAALAAEVALRPSAASKAERGYRLLRGERAKPAKARAIALDAAMAPGEAARRVLAAGLEQLQANEEGILSSHDPEFVHQGRIALRRMRSAMRMFRDPIGRKRSRALRAALGELGGALGAARDWDVFGTEVLPALRPALGGGARLQALRRRVDERRRRERAAARAVIRSTRYARAMLEMSRLVAEPVREEAGGERLVDFAARVLRKRHRRLLRAARGLARLTPAGRHRLRIEVKRLRYGTDALASLYPPGEVREYIAALQAVQDALGAANDALTGERLLAELAPPKALRDAARRWLAPRTRGDTQALDRLMQRLARARWDRGPQATRKRMRLRPKR